jgi:hypothetical protein
VSRTEEYLQQSQGIIKKEFPEVIVGYQAGNIADEATVTEMFRNASELLGPLDVLVFTFFFSMLMGRSIVRDKPSIINRLLISLLRHGGEALKRIF